MGACCQGKNVSLQAQDAIVQKKVEKKITADLYDQTENNLTSPRPSKGDAIVSDEKKDKEKEAKEVS